MDLRPLRHRDFRYLYAAQSISFLGTMVTYSYMSGPLLGHVEAGAVAALAGVQASIVSGGVLCVAGVVACGLLLPHFRRYDARTFAPARVAPQEEPA